MPRKNYGMWYEVHPTPVKGDDGRNIVYVRPKSGMKLTMKQLENYCERTYNLRYGEMSRAFDMFIRAAGRFLAEDYRIETPIAMGMPSHKPWMICCLFPAVVLILRATSYDRVCRNTGMYLLAQTHRKYKAVPTLDNSHHKSA